MSFATALARLATWSVSGVTSYAIGAEDLIVGPSLVINLASSRLPSQQRTITGGKGTFIVNLDHLLLYKSMGLALPQERVAIAATVDLYYAAAAGDWLLNDTLIEPLTFYVTFGQIEWNNFLFYGAVFNHTWVMRAP